MRTSILPEGPVTFADYFKLTAEIGDVLAVFGYTYGIESCKLPRNEGGNSRRLKAVRENLESIFPHVVLTNETARREFLIAPVLSQVALEADAIIRVEYSLEVDDKLHGTLDYLLRAKHRVLVIEAKNGELKKAFTQLAVELLALDRWLGEESPEPLFYGAVSMGNVWQFGVLDRGEKRIVEDINTYSVPRDLEEIVRILHGILTE